MELNNFFQNYNLQFYVCDLNIFEDSQILII